MPRSSLRKNRLRNFRRAVAFNPDNEERHFSNAGFVRSLHIVLVREHGVQLRRGRPRPHPRCRRVDNREDVEESAGFQPRNSVGEGNRKSPRVQIAGKKFSRAPLSRRLLTGGGKFVSRVRACGSGRRGKGVLGARPYPFRQKKAGSGRFLKAMHIYAPPDLP